jgi:hypothetical protein
LLKSRSVSGIADALHRIASGQPVFDPVPNTASHWDPPFVLTPREAEVLRRIAVGQHTRTTRPGHRESGPGPGSAAAKRALDIAVSLANWPSNGCVIAKVFLTFHTPRPA